MVPFSKYMVNCSPQLLDTSEAKLSLPGPLDRPGYFAWVLGMIKLQHTDCIPYSLGKLNWIWSREPAIMLLKEVHFCLAGEIESILY